MKVVAGTAATLPPRKALRDLPIEQLIAVHDGLEAAIDAAYGVFNQPRTEDDAAHMIEDHINPLGFAHDAVVKEIARRKPAGRTEWEAWASFIIAHHAKHDEWGDLITALNRLLSQDGRIALTR